MSYASRLVMNDNNYTGVSGLAESGVFVNSGQLQYNIGFEEWNNIELFKKHNVGYVDCYRSHVRHDITDLYLYKKDHTTPNTTYKAVGIMKRVTQLQDNQIPGLLKLIIQNIGVIQASFNNIGDFRPINGPNHQYYHSLQSNHIVANPGKSFVLNIRYESVELFEGKGPNLTNLTREKINNLKRINQRYHLEKEWKMYWQ
jgi:hypothetical protein